jgi:hypothetical protein
MTNVAIVSAPVLDLVETPKRSPKVQIVFPKHARGQEQFKRQAQRDAARLLPEPTASVLWIRSRHRRRYPS